MKQTEKDKLIEAVRRKVRHNGMPMDVRMGGAGEVTDWIAKLLEEVVEVSKPIGVKRVDEYDYCPECGKVVGTSGHYCKYCGTYLKEAPDD